ncbi:Imm1 family immunity protein [Streptomyces sp. NPDC085942]|uniref:Imm1 family immunity protein n=1 Tax=Streptomyces sp. NPDC085942 TaxID=3365743 RepID=UPI0037D1DEF2
MILAVHHLGQTRKIEHPEDALEHFDNLSLPKPGGEKYVQGTWLVFAEEGAGSPLSMLEASINLENSLGGVVWFAGWNDAKTFKENSENPQSDLGDHFWVSDAEISPDFDPEVLSDHDSALYFDPRGVIPVTQIRSAVEEFCQSMGHRPNCTKWVPGRQDGSRLS